MEPDSLVAQLLQAARSSEELPPLRLTGVREVDEWDMAVRCAFLDTRLYLRAIVHDVTRLTEPGSVARLAG